MEAKGGYPQPEGKPLLAPTAAATDFGSNPKWVRQSSTDSMDPVAATFEVPAYGEVQHHDKADFLVDGRQKVWWPTPDEGHDQILALSESQEIMIKTVSNEDWIDLIRRLQGPRIRTSTSLPPPGGRLMKFFGNKTKETTSCLGMLWDRRELDLSEAYIWPSGYFAKSEFNVQSDGSMRNGRREAMSTVEQVLEKNLSNQGSGQVLSYNEFLTHVHGITGVCGLFVRTTMVKHLLWAMGIRSLIKRTLPGVGELPLFVHDIERGFFPFSVAAQRKVVQEFLMYRQDVTLDKAEMPVMPVDTHHLQLNEQQQLEFHGAYGITSEALTSVIDKMLDHEAGSSSDEDDGRGRMKAIHEEQQPMSKEAAQDILLCGLRGAVDNSNTAAALSLVRKVAPILFHSSLQHPEEEGTANIIRAAATRGNDDFAACLHNLEARASSKSMLVTVGATIVLNDFLTGRMLPRIADACKELEAWLQYSNSVVFRLKSWNELKAVSGGEDAPTFGAFVSRKAVENRTNFLEALKEVANVERSHDLLHGMEKLQSMVAQLRHPCLRLKMLQHILDLDDRYNIQAILAVASLAHKVIASEPGLRAANTPAGRVAARRASVRPVMPQKRGMAPLFEMEAAACAMQGVDIYDAQDK